ncbi:MAG: nucleotidyltransferase family protein [Gammaproteobacteria bacterium]
MNGSRHKDNGLRDLTAALLADAGANGGANGGASAGVNAADVLGRASRVGGMDDAQHLAACVRYWGQQRIQPMIARRLLADASLPPAWLDWARGVWGDNGVRALLHIKHLVAAERLLSAHGIPMLPIKGVVLSTLLHGDPGFRRCGDIDIVVPPDAFDTAVALLQAQGYRARHAEHMTPDGRLRPALKRCRNEVGLIGPQGDHILEVHHRLCKYRGMFADDFDGLLADTTVVPLAGRDWRTIGRRTLIAYLAFHAMISRWSAMKWLLDVPAAIDRLGPESIEHAYAAARRGSFVPLLDAALVLGHRLVGRPEPGPRGSASSCRRLVRAVWRRMGDGRYAVEDQRDPLQMIGYRLTLVTGVAARWRMAETSALSLVL